MGEATQIHKHPRNLDSKRFTLTIKGFVISETKIIVYIVIFNYAMYSYYMYLLALRVRNERIY